MSEPEDIGDDEGVPVEMIDLWCDWEEHEARGVTWDDWQAKLREAPGG